MAVSNGQQGDETTFNNAYISKTTDSTTVANIDLNDPDAASGTQVTNVQREHNSIASYVGKAINALKDILPSWTSTAVGTGTDDLTQRAEALTVESGVQAADIALRQLLSEKGLANGYAELDGTGKVPSSQLTVDAFQYLGTYDAATNTPTLVDATGNTGDLYRVTVAGTQNFGSGNITFAVGDKVVYNPSAIWEKWDTDDSDSALRDLSNLTSPTAVNQVLNTLDINVVGEVGINTAPVTDVPLSIQATASANSGIMTWTDSQANDTWEWAVYDNGYLSLIKNGLTVRSFFLTAQGTVGIGNTATTGRFAVAYPADTLQVEIKGDTIQTADLVNFNDSLNNVLSSVGGDGSSTWPQIDVSAEGEVRFQDATGGEYMGLKAPGTVTVSTTLTLPDGAGANGEVLTTNGADTLSWAAPAAGGADTDLGNLTATAINLDLDPSAGNVRDLGNVSDYWKAGYINRIDLVNGGTAWHRIRATVTGMPSGASSDLAFIGLSKSIGLWTNNESAASTNSPPVRLETGNAAGTTSDSGNIEFTTGTATQTRGKIVIKDGSETGAGAGAVWTQAAADGVGAWVAPAGGGGATTELDNLGTTAVNADLRMDPTKTVILPNDVALRGRNGGDSADIDIIKVDAGNNLAISVKLGPVTTAVTDLGSGSTRFRRGYFSSAVRVGPSSSEGGEVNDFVSTPTNVSDTLGFFTIEDTKALSAFTKTTNSASVNSGEVLIESGDADGTTSNSGNISLQTGTATGTRGSIKLNDSSVGTAGHVWTSTDINGTGNWAAAGGGGDLWSDVVDSNIIPDGGGTRNLGETGTRFNFIFGIAAFIGSGAANGHRLVNSETLPSGATLVAGHRSEAGQHLGLYTIDQAATKNVYVETGNASGGNSGSINIQPGTATGTRGKVVIKDGTEAGAGAGAVWTQAAADGIGGWAAPAAGGATTSLNNLAATAVNVDILPATTAVTDLGSATKRWAEVHATTGYIRTIQPTISGGTTLNLQTVATTNTGGITTKTGNGSGNSGDVRLETGTAGTTRGQIVFSARQINHSQVVSTQVVWENGVTGSRPGSPVTAQRYFDTTLGIPIWYDGTNWIDATGTTV